MVPVDEDISKEDLSRLLSAIRAMARASTNADAEHVITAYLRMATSLTQSHRAALFFSQEENSELKLIGQRGRADVVWGKAPPIPEATRVYAIEASEAPFAPAGGLRHIHIIEAPLRVHDRAAGVLVLARTGEYGYYPGDINLATILSEHASVCLESARLLSELERELERTKIILDVGRTLTAPISLQARLETATELLTRVVDATNAFILVFVEEEDVLCGLAASNPEIRDDFIYVRIPMDVPSIAVRAVKNRVPVAVEDARISQEVRRELVDRYAARGLLSLPLLVGVTPVGAVVIDDTRQARNWTALEIERAELITHQLAAAIANARLFAKVTEGYAKLERANLELMKREQLASLGRLSATLAHEVRNPLGVLFNSIGTLGKMIPPSGDAATLLEIMGEEAGRLNQLVSELLDFARPVTPSFEPESLEQVVAEAITAASTELGPDAATITFDRLSALPLMPIDARMLRRALVNLIINGAQAAGSGGSVIVRGQESTESGRRIARIDVIDSGQGILPEVAARIFEPFFTTKATGIGLGLAIVRSIVEAHGGDIELDPDATDGTSFVIRLPIRSNELGRPGW